MTELESELKGAPVVVNIADVDQRPRLSVSEIAIACGVSAATVRRAIERGNLRAVQFEGQYRVSPLELDRYLREGTHARV